jgi:hypothetical protein
MNGCSLTTGKVGQAFTFDEINDYVSLPNNSLNFIGDFSVSFWVYTNISFRVQHFFNSYSVGSTYGYGYYCSMDNGVMSLHFVNGGTHESTYQIPYTWTQNWHHVVVTRKRSTSTNVYINGSLVSGTFTFGNVTKNPSYQANQICNLGGINNGTSNLLNGKIELYNSGNGKQITATPIVQTGLVLNLDASRTSSYPNTGTTWTDISGNGNNGTLTNGPVFGTASGGVITFDGVNDYVNLGTSANLRFTKNFTINIWFKFNSKSGIQTIISNNESAGYGIISNYNLEGFVGTAANRIVTFYHISGTYYLVGDNLTNYNIDTWYNVTTTYDGNTIKYYRNGTLIDSYSIVGTITTSNEPLIIGTNPNSGGTNFSDFFNGNIGQTMIYNRVLSSTEITQNFNATKSRFGL